jgi:DUF4097 and DUF4098 domain-containing protein YvlB
MMRSLILVTLVAAVAPTATAAAQERVDRHRAVERHRSMVRHVSTVLPTEETQQSRQRRSEERETQTERVSRTVNIGANGEIELSNISGDIQITRGGGTTASIEAVKTAHGASADEARAMLALVQVEITERGTRAEVRTRYPQGEEARRNNRRNINVSVSYTVAAPEGTRIFAKSISGNISARDISGGLTLESISGTVRIANAGRVVNSRSISGDIELSDTTVDGALEAGTISGTVRLRKLTARSVALNSVSGNVQIEDVTADRVGAQAISGNITFAGDLRPNGRYEFTSHSGNIRLAIPAGAAFQVEASSFSGSINTDIPLTLSGGQSGQSGRRNRALRGQAGSGGGATLDLTTFSGTILITKR